VSAVRRLVLEMSVSLDGYVATRDVSKTLKTAGWAHTRIASGDLAEEVDRLKREPGKDLLAHGGARFAQALSRAGVVDEYRLRIQPAALGAGLPLFGELPRPLHLDLVGSRPFATGAVVHAYRRRT
jgi:dihydrofolate reductase